MTQRNILKAHIDKRVSYLDSFYKLANCHMVDYFSQNAYDSLLPDMIRSEINKVGQKEALSLIFNDNLEKMPALQKFINNSKLMRLQNCPDICINLNTFNNKLKKYGAKDLNSLKLDIFMNSKKSHEVEVLSNVAAFVQNVAKTSHIIDIGDGKGYLSSMLAMHYKIPVLGVDASEINTNSSVKRLEKLAKVWNSVATGEKSKHTTKDLYRQITKHVDENVNFTEMIQNIFLEKPSAISLVGLHTCGNLASASLRIFNKCSEIKTISNVGCCYHFICERFEDDPEKFIRNPTHDFGFPMSLHLNEKKVILGRKARMIAAQSIDRIFHDKELPSSSIFYRALLEILMKKYYPDINIKDVGRFRKPALNFLDYTRKALKRLNVEVDLSDQTISDFYYQHEQRRDELNVFYIVRAMLAPVVESIILLDRLLFLYENGHDESYLVQLFDPVISPRCYGIIAIK